MDEKTEHSPGRLVAVFEEMGGYDCMSSSWDIVVADDKVEEYDRTKVAVLDCGDYADTPAMTWEDGGANSPLAEANARRMALCWNTHDELVTALERAERVAALAQLTTDTMSDRAITSELLDALPLFSAAIAAAKEDQ